MRALARRLTPLVITATALVTLTGGAAGAAVAPPGGSVRTAGSSGATGVVFAVDGLSPSVIRAFDPFVTYRTHSGFTLAAPSWLVSRDPAGAAAVRASLLVANSQLRATALPASQTAQKTHGGVDVFWWGWRLWLDEYATKRLIVALAGGAGASWLAATLTSWTGIGGLSGVAIALLLGQTAVTAALCDTRSKGVVFDVPFVGSVSCAAR